MARADVPDAVAEFCDATAHNDVDRIMSTLAPDAQLESPLSGRMVFRGHADLRILLAAVYGGLSGLTWQPIIGDGSTRVAVSHGRIGGVAITDAMVLELDDAGRIKLIRPHLRPWLAITVFAALLGPKIARHPGVIRRALLSR